MARLIAALAQAAFNTSLSGGLVINGLALQGDGQVVATGFHLRPAIM